MRFFRFRSILLMDKIPLADFFERTDFNNIKGLDSLIFPRLLDLCLTCPDFTGH